MEAKKVISVHQDNYFEARGEAKALGGRAEWRKTVHVVPRKQGQTKRKRQGHNL